jgi:hypothetical protein
MEFTVSTQYNRSPLLNAELALVIDRLMEVRADAQNAILPGDENAAIPDEVKGNDQLQRFMETWVIGQLTEVIGVLNRAQERDK